MANLKNITDVPVVESAEGLNLIVNDNGAAKQIAASAVGAQADFAVTDETNPAFIKNKAFAQADWTMADENHPAYIKNKPDLSNVGGCVIVDLNDYGMGIMNMVNFDGQMGVFEIGGTEIFNIITSALNDNKSIKFMSPFIEGVVLFDVITVMADNDGSVYQVTSALFINIMGTAISCQFNITKNADSDTTTVFVMKSYIEVPSLEPEPSEPT